MRSVAFLPPAGSKARVSAHPSGVPKQLCFLRGPKLGLRARLLLLGCLRTRVAAASDWTAGATTTSQEVRDAQHWLV